MYLTNAGTGDSVGILDVRYIAPWYLSVRHSTIFNNNILFYVNCEELALENKIVLYTYNFIPQRFTKMVEVDSSDQYKMYMIHLALES